MEPAVVLDNMSVSQKLRLMEAIWDDLCRHGADISSPDWHGRVLSGRQSRVDRGEARFIDWDDAKKQIRDAAS